MVEEEGSKAIVEAVMIWLDKFLGYIKVYCWWL